MEIKDFKDIHKNNRCFIIGTGPSLNDVDVSLLENEITLGMSRVMLHPNLHIKYYCVEGERTVKSTHYEIWDLKCDAKFIPYRYSYLDFGINTVFVNFPHFPKKIPNFSFDCAEVVYWGCNVLYMALQLATYMGCNPIYLIGIDWFASEKDMTKHFHAPDIIEEYDPPNLHTQNVCIGYAAHVLKKHEVQVYNLCPTSYLKVFPFKNIGDVL